MPDEPERASKKESMNTSNDDASSSSGGDQPDATGLKKLLACTSQCIWASLGISGHLWATEADHGFGGPHKGMEPIIWQ